MPRRPSIPCAGCGKLLWVGGKGDLPPGEKMCQPCRRVATCSEPDCPTRGGLMRGICAKHYRRARVERRFGNPECSKEGCPRGVIGRGLCDVHAVARRRREGYRDPPRPRRGNCGGAQRRAKNFRAPYEPIRASAIFERDGWRCGICSGEVDPQLAWPHPGCAVLDHVVPLARLRTPGHVRGNVQCAHNRCNRIKGDRLQGEIDLAPFVA